MRFVVWAPPIKNPGSAYVSRHITLSRLTSCGALFFVPSRLLVPVYFVCSGNGTALLTRVRKITCFCFNYYYNYNLKFSITSTIILGQVIVIQSQFQLKVQ